MHMIRVLTGFVNWCWIFGTTTEVGSPLGSRSRRGIGVPLIHCQIFGTVLLSRLVLTFGPSYTKHVVLVQRGQKMSL